MANQANKTINTLKNLNGTIKWHAMSYNMERSPLLPLGLPLTDIPVISSAVFGPI